MGAGKEFEGWFELAAATLAVNPFFALIFFLAVLSVIALGMWLYYKMKSKAGTDLTILINMVEKLDDKVDIVIADFDRKIDSVSDELKEFRKETNENIVKLTDRISKMEGKHGDDL